MAPVTDFLLLPDSTSCAFCRHIHISVSQSNITFLSVLNFWHCNRTFSTDSSSPQLHCVITEIPVHPSSSIYCFMGFAARIEIKVCDHLGPWSLRYSITTSVPKDRSDLASLVVDSQIGPYHQHMVYVWNCTLCTGYEILLTKVAPVTDDIDKLNEEDDDNIGTRTLANFVHCINVNVYY